MRTSLLFLASIALASSGFLACSSSSGDGGGTTDGGHADSGGGPNDSSGPATCGDLHCPTYECTCNDGSKMNGSGCSDGVCETGQEECDFVCSSSGGVRSFKEVDTSDSGPGSDSGPSCLTTGDACGDCVATSCCPEATACASDKECQSTAVCVSLKCTGSWDKCATECNTSGNANFSAYSACIVAHGCSTICKP